MQQQLIGFFGIKGKRGVCEVKMAKIGDSRSSQESVSTAYLATTAGYVDSTFGFVYKPSRSGRPQFNREEVNHAKAQFPIRDLPTYEGETEEEFEDWGDGIRKLYRLYGQRCGAQYLIEALLPRLPLPLEDAAATAYAEHPDDLDAWFDTIAREVYCNSKYIFVHYLTLFDWDGVSPSDFHVSLSRRLDRHCRLCIRWGELLPAHKMVVETKMRSLIPEHVQDVIDARFPHVPLLTFLLECGKRCKTHVKDAPVPVYATQYKPAVEYDDTPPVQGPVQQSSRAPTSPCPCCGEEGHWRKHCKYLLHYCANCGTRGHLAQVCRNMNVKDTMGRDVVKIKEQAKSTRIQIPKESTDHEHMTHAKGNINHVVQKHEERLAAARAKAAAKRAEAKATGDGEDQPPYEEEDMGDGDDEPLSGRAKLLKVLYALSDSKLDFVSRHLSTILPSHSSSTQVPTSPSSQTGL